MVCVNLLMYCVVGGRSECRVGEPAVHCSEPGEEAEEV